MMKKTMFKSQPDGFPISYCVHVHIVRGVGEGQGEGKKKNNTTTYGECWTYLVILESIVGPLKKFNICLTSRE